MVTFPRFIAPARAIVYAVLVLTATATSIPVAAQTTSTTKPAQTPPRTVSWYADNQRARASTQLACLDDPGHLGATADCINANRASTEVALREARFITGTMDPRDPVFWSNDPTGRHNWLLMCRGTPQLPNCDAARRSLLIEAGLKKR